jgi:hypothetical protein
MWMTRDRATGYPSLPMLLCSLMTIWRCAPKKHRQTRLDGQLGHPSAMPVRGLAHLIVEIRWESDLDGPRSTGQGSVCPAASARLHHSRRSVCKGQKKECSLQLNCVHAATMGELRNVLTTAINTELSRACPHLHLAFA